MKVQNINNSRYQNFSSLQVIVARNKDHNAFYKAYSGMIGSQVGLKDGILFNLAPKAHEQKETATLIRQLGHKVAELQDDWWNHGNKPSIFS